MKKIIKETLVDGRVQYRVKMSIKRLRVYYADPLPYIECIFSTLDEAKMFLQGYDSEIAEQHDVYVISE